MQTVLQLPAVQTGAIDALVWKADVDFTGLWGIDVQLIVIQGWQGDVRFYRRADLSGGGISLPATLVGANDHVRFSQRGAPLTFKTHLPGDAFDRVERFRASGPLFARLEGELQTLALGPHRALENHRIQLLLQAWTPGHVCAYNSVECEPRAIRDHWLEHVLPAFGKPYRVLIEARLPKLAPASEAGARAVEHLEDAERAFIHGHYERAGHTTYKALEALQELLGGVEVHYGALVRGQLALQIKSVHGITHKNRHDASKEHSPPIEWDRSLAMHVMTAAKSIAGIVFACEQQPQDGE
jgi:hypothetical protein